MTLSIELLPAPLGPMIARTSCSLTSKLMSVSAFTPPKRSEMCSTFSTTSPIRRALVTSGRLRRRLGGERLRVVDPKIGGDHARAPILEPHQRLDVLDGLATVQRVDQHAVLLGDEPAAHLARACQ